MCSLRWSLGKLAVHARTSLCVNVHLHEMIQVLSQGLAVRPGLPMDGLVWPDSVCPDPPLPFTDSLLDHWGLWESGRH